MHVLFLIHLHFNVLIYLLLNWISVNICKNIFPAKFPLGVHAAACVRVGNALGAGDTNRALITSKVTLMISG